MEWEVLSYVVQGFSDKEIASLIQTSVKTVERRKQSLRRRLGVRSTSELVAKAVTCGVIRSHPYKNRIG
jgi:DNA-binding NarL/FixJ family response regulator